MIKRKDSWDVELHNFIESHAETPFEWGQHDCARFVCNAIFAMTGTDVGEEFRDKYSTQLGAARCMLEVTGSATFEGAIEYITNKFEMKELPSVLFAQRGDVVVFDGEEGAALGIVYLNGVDAVFVSPEGFKRIPVKQCRRAWGVR